MRKILVVLIFMLCVSSSNAQPLHWQPTKVPYGGPVKGLAKLGGVLFASTSNFHVLRSDDSGRTWSPISHYLDSLNYYRSLSLGAVWGKSTFVFGSSLSRVYVSNDTGITWQMDTLVDTLPDVIINDSLGYSRSNGHLLRTTDTGRTWSTISPKIVNETSAFAASGSTIYLENAYGNAQYTGIYRSLDNGNTWLRIDTSLPPVGLAAFGNTVFAFSNDSTLFRSTDSGQTWNQIQPGFGDMVYHIFNIGQYLFAAIGSNGQIFRSSDSGISWTLLPNGLDGYTINSMLAIGNELVAATRNGIYISSDNGDSWRISNAGVNGRTINDIQSRGDTLFAIAGGLFRSTDFGENWNLFGNGLLGESIESFATGSNLWYTFTPDQVFRSTNLGNDWDSCAPVPKPPEGGIVVQGSKIIIGGFDGFLRSQDSGNSWCCADSGGFGIVVSPLELTDSLVANIGDGPSIGLSSDFGETWYSRIPPKGGLATHALILSSNIMFDGTDNGVYRSFDTGKNWEFVNSEGATMALAGRGNAVFAGSNTYGVSLSSDSGVNWKDETNGLPSLNITKLVIGQSQIYALLSDGELYRAQLGSSSVSSAGIVSPRIKIFPDPISSLATIMYSLPNSSSVTIALFDPLGREVTRPVESQWRDAGEHELSIDASRLEAGVYECRLVSGGLEAVRKIVVFR